MEQKLKILVVDDEQIVLDSINKHLRKENFDIIGVLSAREGLEKIDKVIDIDQSPIGRTPRSNPATYTGVLTPIRELLARLPEFGKSGLPQDHSQP